MSEKSSLQPLQNNQVTVTGCFWTTFREALRRNGLIHQFREIEETKRLQNFLDVQLGKSGTHTGYIFNDSDVYKWLEACAYFYRDGLSEELTSGINLCINAICSAQEPNGYINTFFQLNHPNLKFRNLISMHEMYCGGHLIEAGVAWYQATDGKDTRLLSAAQKFADLLVKTFGPNGKPGYPGHEEIELALIKLSELVGKLEYKELAYHFIQTRGARPSPFQGELFDEEAMKLSPHSKRLHCQDETYSGEYCQDHLPITEHQSVVGHAVRAMYLYIAAASMVSELEDPKLESALLNTWNNLTSKRMYVTAGIGPSGENEGFTSDYDLPNLTAYAETCAACGLAWWGSALLNHFKNGEIGDAIECALFNGALAGISLDGTRYFYDNPLESRGNHQRTPWFPCACCPPNIARLIGNVGQLFGSVSSDTFWLHIPCGFKANLELKGTKCSVNVISDYPLSGKVKIEIEPDKETYFEFRIRIPAWADELQTEVPGLEFEAEYIDGYAVFKKKWKSGDIINLEYPLTPKWVSAHPRVLDDLGRVALTCGPLVYCAESTGSELIPQLFEADCNAEVRFKEVKDWPWPCFEVDGVRTLESYPDQLYASEEEIRCDESSQLFIPYFTWNNRGPSHMQVWVRKY